MKTRTKKAPRRKPSVALSRKFTVSEEQLMDQLCPPNSKLEPIDERSLRTKKDLPLPKVSPKNESPGGEVIVDDITLEDVAYLKEDDTLQDIDKMLEKFNIPWMSEILRNHDYFSK